MGKDKLELFTFINGDIAKIKTDKYKVRTRPVNGRTQKYAVGLHKGKVYTRILSNDG